jgi:hypothetical protein
MYSSISSARKKLSPAQSSYDDDDDDDTQKKTRNSSVVAELRVLSVCKAKEKGNERQNAVADPKYFQKKKE